MHATNTVLLLFPKRDLFINSNIAIEPFNQQSQLVSLHNAPSKMC